MNKIFMHLVADYGTGDPAFGEVIQKLKCINPEFDIFPTSVPKFDTLATGFWIYQYALSPHPENMIIYSNTAPRKDKKTKRVDNEGEILMLALLDNGVKVIAVNSGYSFSFVKPHIKAFHVINVANKGSQFRSRDFYPQAVQNIVLGTKDALKSIAETSHIPDVPQNRIVWIDGYENIKTTIRKSQIHFEAGTKLKVSINNVKRTALVTGGSFSVAEGELAFSPGSSGNEDPLMELFLRGGSAKKLFELERAGAKVSIEVT
jgi:S-adenosylmethionine hydrolase